MAQEYVEWGFKLKDRILMLVDKKIVAYLGFKMSYLFRTDRMAKKCSFYGVLIRR